MSPTHHPAIRRSTLPYLADTARTRAAALLALLALSPACDDVDVDDDSETTMELRQGESGDPSIERVYFGQTHLLESNDPLFGLVADRPAAIKAYITGPDPDVPLLVNAKLILNGAVKVVPLTAPATLPSSVNLEPGQVDHRLDDSFNGVIPADWVQPGLIVSIKVRPCTQCGQGPYDQQAFSLDVGAPSRVELNMFDIAFFQDYDVDYPDGWLEEIREKWPVADLTLERTDHIVFDQVLMPPREGVGPFLVSSQDDYLAQSGISFDGEQNVALRWSEALRDANGQRRTRLTYVNIIGVPAGGQADASGGFFGVGGIAPPNWPDLTQEGLLHHELGHALSLLDNDVPYCGDMHGIPIISSGHQIDCHVGPTWGIDMRDASPRFLSPVVQADSVDPSLAGSWKRDPMAGGGQGDQEEGDLLRMFSDYSVDRMRGFLEEHLVEYDGSQYNEYDPATGEYDIPVDDDDGVKYAIEPNEQVISVMMSAAPTIQHVYPPIGAYTGGLIQRFRINNIPQRNLAEEIFCPADGCDLSLRVIQGGVSRTYLLPVSFDPAADPMDDANFSTAAVNLRASDGAISLVELRHTPDGEHDGPPPTPEVLASWSPS